MGTINNNVYWYPVRIDKTYSYYVSNGISIQHCMFAMMREGCSNSIMSISLFSHCIHSVNFHCYLGYICPEMSFQQSILFHLLQGLLNICHQIICVFQSNTKTQMKSYILDPKGQRCWKRKTQVLVLVLCSRERGRERQREREREREIGNQSSSMQSCDIPVKTQTVLIGIH